MEPAAFPRVKPASYPGRYESHMSNVEMFALNLQYDVIRVIRAGWDGDKEQGVHAA